MKDKRIRPDGICSMNAMPVLNIKINLWNFKIKR